VEVEVSFDGAMLNEGIRLVRRCVECLAARSWKRTVEIER
jgi:hypothetical protein